MSSPLTLTLAFPAPLRGMGIGEGGYKIGRSLVEHGQRVRLICTTPANSELDTSEFESLARVTITGTLKLALKTPLRWRPDILVNLHNNRFDLAARGQLQPSHLFYGYSEASLFSLKLAQKQGAVTVLHAANSHIGHMRELLDEENRLWPGSPRLVNRLSEWKIEAEYRAVDFIRTQSSWVYGTLAERGVPTAKLLWVPPAVDLARYAPIAQADWPTDFRACFVGSFDLRKGIQYLLPAWDALNFKPGTAQLLMHGGAGNRYINRLIAAYQPHPTIEWRAGGPPDATYRDASVCIVPSVEDGFCYVALEAMAAGRPVILTTNVGAKDLVEEGVNGFIVPIRDRAALTERLDWCYRHPERLAEMGRAARATAEQYTYANEGRQLLDHFQRMV